MYIFDINVKGGAEKELHLGMFIKEVFRRKLN